MRHIRAMVATLGMAVLLGAAVPARAAEQPATLGDMATLSAASERVFARISPALVRIHIDLAPDRGVPPELRKDFENWMRDQRHGPNEAGRDGRPGAAPDGQPGGPRGGGPGDSRARHGPGARSDEAPPRPEGAPPGDDADGPPRMRQMQLFREYLRQRIQQPPDARTLAMLRGIAGAMRNGPTEDLLGVVFDDAGHVLVLSGLLRPSDKPLEVVLGDGSTGQAQVIGSDPQLDLSVLKLLGTAPAWTARAAAPAPGALLLSMAARRGAASWVVASISPATQRRGAEERFPLALEDPGPVFLFNGQGELVALGNERVATPVAALERELKLLMTVGHIVRQDFGVGYEVLGPNAVERQDQPALTRRPALKVERVKAGSLAEQAGVKKGDIILSVGEHPVYPFMLPRIMRELATRTGAMKIVLLREGKEVTVEVAAPEDGNVGR